MKTSKCFVLGLLVVAALSCTSTGIPNDYDDYEIYVEFLSQNIWERIELENIELGNVVINSVTDTSGMDYESKEPWEIGSYIRESLPALQRSTIRSFETRNRKPIVLSAENFEQHSVSIVAEHELSKIFNRAEGGGGWWPEYYERFADAQGILTLSRVGFNSEGTQALLYYGNQYAGLGGKGEMVLFDRVDNRWLITKRYMIWIS